MLPLTYTLVDGRLIELSKPIVHEYSPRTRGGRDRKNSPCYYRCHSFGDPGVYFRHKEASFQSGRATPNFQDRVRAFLKTHRVNQVSISFAIIQIRIPSNFDI